MHTQLPAATIPTPVRWVGGWLVLLFYLVDEVRRCNGGQIVNGDRNNTATYNRITGLRSEHNLFHIFIQIGKYTLRRNDTTHSTNYRVGDTSSGDMSTRD